MLELITESIFEIINLIFRMEGRKTGFRRSARAVIRLYWLLSKLEIHSERFINNLESLHQCRFANRTYSGITSSLWALEKDVGELYKMCVEDNIPFMFAYSDYIPGFWRVIDIFDESLHEEFIKIIGFKLIRLAAWKKFISGMLGYVGELNKTQRLLTPTPSFKPPPSARELLRKWNRDIQKLIEANQIRTVDIRDDKQVQEEIEKAKAVLKDIRKAKKHLATFIKEHYNFEDLF